MALIKSVRGYKPEIPESCFLADNATVIGDVTIGKGCTIWFNTVVRGDVNSIKIGDFVNIQDGAVIHGTYEKSDTKLGNNVSIGHNATIHGCEIMDNVLVGMGAIIMDGCVVEPWSFIAAGAVLLPGTKVASGSLYAGVPAKFIKKATDEQIEVIKRTTKNYPMYAKWFE